ncbi:multiple epidermal growth factor-like domains protein 10 isoform X3 [Saccostrea cucullata]|uniref:multiple epidermal growth factor-like domains protein 10 isoform X3 n=1 Tax=Saccostrea cuccullata TaxID=36930 RepID=UPI002ED194E7
MSLNWTLSLVIFCVVFKTVYFQCIEKDCVCHCTCCSFCIETCKYCYREWSGTPSNGCQRKNIAYNPQTASQTSTFDEKYASNAVDEDGSSYSRTKAGLNVTFSLTFSEVKRLKNIYIDYYELGQTGARYEVYVKNSTETSLNIANLCRAFISIATKYLNSSLTCAQTMIGDSVVIRKVGRGSLLFYEVKVYECSQGTYGYFCDKRCSNCLDNQCDGFTGVCASGCKSGWYGKNCDRECPFNCKSPSFCNRYLGCTECPDGFSGPRCYKCTTGTYGKNCSLKCLNCDPYNCDNVIGCQECYPGFHGPNCTMSCPENCKNKSCLKQYGDCYDGCEDGFMGPKCDTSCNINCATCILNDRCSSCVAGLHGGQCELTCPETCGGKRACDKDTGRCDECGAGKYGENCTQFCSKNCISGTCRRDGECIGGCKEGWLGLICSMECSENYCSECILSDSAVLCSRCDDGYFLDTENKCQSCSSNCLSCESELKCTRCKPTFTGNLCEECSKYCIDHLCYMDGICASGCKNRKYGVGCSSACNAYCEHCYDEYNCTQCLPGYYGRNCSFSCSYQNCYCTLQKNCLSCNPGFYGKHCQNSCPPNCLTCNAFDYCTSCRGGWSGRICQCNVNCKDESGDNGKCVNGCKGSFYGDYCNASCPVENCQKCDQKSGNCTRCSDGRYGIKCGLYCSKNCVGKLCDIEGGCLQGCEEGFTGGNCGITLSTYASQAKPYVIAVSVLGVLVIMFAVLLLIFLVKRRRDRERRVKETYESVQVTFQETDHEYDSIHREPAN